MTTPTTERYEIALNTPAGQLTTAIEVPTGFVPITAIVPVVRRLGEEAQALEQARSIDSGKVVSCQKGCAACCRMMVPLSPPEAFAIETAAVIPRALKLCVGFIDSSLMNRRGRPNSAPRFFA